MKIAFAGSLALLALSLHAATNQAQAAVIGAVAAPPPGLGGLQLISGHLQPEIARAPIVGRLPAWKTLHLAIGLPVRNGAEARALVASVSDPASPNYRHYLSQAQYAARFGPTVNDYREVLAFARAAHFTVTRTYANRMLVDVDATVSSVQQALHVTMQQRLRPDGTMFYAPSNEPAVALHAALLHIGGLENFRLPKPTLASVAPAGSSRLLHRGAQPDLSSGPGGTFAGPDFRHAYAFGATQSGAGQCIGLLEFDSSFFPGDIAAYQAKFGLPPISPQTILLDGYSGVPVISSGEKETALDIEVAQAMAPGVPRIAVFEGSNQDDIFAAMASPSSGGLCNQLSASWNFSVDATSQQLAEQMALQGQSLYVSSGDSGGFTSDTNDDRDLSDITVVGGTELALDDNFHWLAEGAWPGSGGGFESSQYVPPFQQNLRLQTGGQPTQRMIPDVAMVAFNTFLIADGGVGFSAQGTSISSPLWAGETALINEKAQSIGQAPLGFADPALYQIASKPALYSANFHDIVSGSNGPFNAMAGYDMVTGLGSPQAKLITTLNPTPTVKFSRMQITIFTGNDDLRADSDLQASFKGIANLAPFCLMRSNNGNPSGVCTGNVYGDVNGAQGWDSWSTRTLTFSNRFANWTWSGSGTMTLSMTSHNNGFETNDNWDVQAMRVVLSNPSTGKTVTLFNVGDFGAPHNSGTCYWRFKPNGSPPTVKHAFNLLPKTTPSDGCPGD